VGILPAAVLRKRFRGVLGISEMCTVEGFSPVDLCTRNETPLWTDANSPRLAISLIVKIFLPCNL
jgi:hypothetical protein